MTKMYCQIFHFTASSAMPLCFASSSTSTPPLPRINYHAEPFSCSQTLHNSAKTAEERASQTQQDPTRHVTRAYPTPPRPQSHSLPSSNVTNATYRPVSTTKFSLFFTNIKYHHNPTRLSPAPVFPGTAVFEGRPTPGPGRNREGGRGDGTGAGAAGTGCDGR